MNVRSVIHWALIAGFVSAPFTNLTVRRFWPRLSGVILLIASLSAVGCVAYVIDRNSVPPFSWLYLGTVVFLGIGISIYGFVCNKFRFAIFLGIVFLCANMALHFFATDFAMDCKRACVAVRKGMMVEQVRSVMPRQFVHYPEYRMEMNTNWGITNEFGYIDFALRPEYSNRPSWTMHLHIFNGRVAEVRASLGECSLEPWDVAGCIALFAICFLRLDHRSEREDFAEPAYIAAATQRLQDIRAQCYVTRPANLSAPARRTLVHFARQKIRWFAYFTRLRNEGDAEE
jgi:hypothetical protein